MTCLFVKFFLHRPEINIRPWHEEFLDIKQGSQTLSWTKKVPRAYWKGNPEVLSPIRTKLLTCNHSRMWGAQVMRQVGINLPCIILVIEICFVVLYQRKKVLCFIFQCFCGDIVY